MFLCSSVYVAKIRGDEIGNIVTLNLLENIYEMNCHKPHN